MKTKKAAVQPAARYNKQHHIEYRTIPRMSSDNLKDQVGLLLWGLCGPISRCPRETGWELLGVLYGQYLSAKSEEVR